MNFDVSALRRQVAAASSAVVFAFAFTQLTNLVEAKAGPVDQPGAIELTEPDGAPAPEEQNLPPKGAAPRTYKPAVVGRKAAEKYMAPRKPATSMGADTHYLALHIGSFVSDNSYQWGAKDSTTNVGKMNLGLTYRVGEWVNSMDLAVRVDWLQYAFDEGKANKLSFAPVIMFPDASSKFPLYFGAGLGLGIFMNQIAKESSLSLDYQLFAGARFFDVIENTGFFIEGGMKNHLLLLSDGQFNGTYAVLGAIFTF